MFPHGKSGNWACNNFSSCQEFNSRARSFCSSEVHKIIKHKAQNVTMLKEAGSGMNYRYFKL